jgi:hypothetical protein
MGFVIDAVALGQVFSEYYGFPLSLSFHQCFILIYSCITEQLTSSSNNTYKNNVSVCWGNMAHDQILTAIVFSVQFPYRLSYCLRAAVLMQEHFFCNDEVLMSTLLLPIGMLLAAPFLVTAVKLSTTALDCYYFNFCTMLSFQKLELLARICFEIRFHCVLQDLQCIRLYRWKETLV